MPLSRFNLTPAVLLDKCFIFCFPFWALDKDNLGGGQFPFLQHAHDPVESGHFIRHIAVPNTNCLTVLCPISDSLQAFYGILMQFFCCSFSNILGTDAKEFFQHGKALFAHAAVCDAADAPSKVKLATSFGLPPKGTAFAHDRRSFSSNSHRAFFISTLVGLLPSE